MQAVKHNGHLECLHTCTITVFGLVCKGAEQSDSETSLTVSVLKNRKCRLKNSDDTHGRWFQNKEYKQPQICLAHANTLFFDSLIYFISLVLTIGNKTEENGSDGYWWMCLRSQGPHTVGRNLLLIGCLSINLQQCVNTQAHHEHIASVSVCIQEGVTLYAIYLIIDKTVTSLFL